jgi:hypothetical protein
MSVLCTLGGLTVHCPAVKWRPVSRLETSVAKLPELQSRMCILKSRHSSEILIRVYSELITNNTCIVAFTS